MSRSYQLGERLPREERCERIKLATDHCRWELQGVERVGRIIFVKTLNQLEIDPEAFPGEICEVLGEGEREERISDELLESDKRRREGRSSRERITEYVYTSLKLSEQGTQNPAPARDTSAQAKGSLEYATTTAIEEEETLETLGGLQGSADTDLNAHRPAEEMETRRLLARLSEVLTQLD